MSEKVTYESLSLQELKKARTEYVTATRCLIARPCYILDWEMSTKSTGVGEVTVHDGTSAASPVRMVSRWIQDYTLRQNYTFPRYFSQGIYVVVGAHVNSVTIHYLPEPVM